MTSPDSIKSLVNLFIGLIDPLLLLLSGIALAVFFWGVAGLIFKGGDEKALEEGKELMKWGIIILFVMLSLWGILRVLYGTFGFQRPFGIPLFNTHSTQK